MKKSIISSTVFILSGLLLISCGVKSIKYPERLKNNSIEASLEINTSDFKIISSRGKKNIRTGFLGKTMRNTDYKKIALEELEKQLPDIANRVKIKKTDEGQAKYIFRFKLIEWETHYSRTSMIMARTTHSLKAAALLINRQTGIVIWQKGVKTGMFDGFSHMGNPHDCATGLRDILKTVIRKAVEDIQN